jgi:hypothetical protein
VRKGVAIATGKKSEGEGQVNLKKLTKTVNKSADEAGSRLPSEQRAAYRAARESVVRARRAAENNEGQLRIG